MKIRTISQLQRLKDPTLNCLFEVSEPRLNGKYTSKNITYETVRNSVNSKLSGDLVSDYGLNKDNGEKISLKDLKNEVENIHNGACTFQGQKTFKNVPICNAVYDKSTIDTDGYSLPNVNYVKTLMEENGNYISPASYIMGDPDNETTYTQDSDYFLHFRIDDSKRDSSEWINPEGEAAGPETCPYTGQLVLYGWLADKGNIKAQDAWVGLYGQVNVLNDKKEARQKWVLLQVQPWIIGKKSSIMQYVSFNIPVSKGLKLKIRTGFAVDGTNTGFAQPNAITYTSWQPNSFVGYVITNY